jgi:hypothetical protein
MHETPMDCEIYIYSITKALWRWEIRLEGTLVRLGTSRTRAAAERDARVIVAAEERRT